jgi:hypothetical protein
VRPSSRVPAREWLAVAFPPTCAGILLAASLAAVFDKPPRTWLAVLAAFTAAFVSSGLYTVWLARRGRLFLRDEAAISENRAKIEGVGIPLGWALGGIALVAAFVLGDAGAAIVMSALAGFLLGFWPGLVANFLRLRREKWGER